MRLKLLIFFLLFIPIVVAEPIDFNVVKYDIQEEFINFKNEVNFHLDEDVDIELNLPISYEDLELSLSGSKIDFLIENNKIKLNIPRETNQLIMEYRTKNLNDFNVEFETQLFSSFLIFEVKLPEGKEIENINPEPMEVVDVNGRVEIKWIMEDVDKGEKNKIFVSYKEENNFVFFVIPFIGVVVIVYYLIRRKDKYGS